MFDGNFVSPGWWFSSSLGDRPLYEIALKGTLGGGSQQDLRLFQGEDVTYIVAMGIATPGWSFRYDVKEISLSGNTTYSQESGFTIDNPENGTFSMVMSSGSWDDIPPKIYQYEFWRIDVGQTYVLCWGRMHVQN